MDISSALHRGSMLVLAGATVVLLASGTDDNPGATGLTAQVDCVEGSVAGAGSTFAQTIVQQWRSNFGTVCPQAGINYQAVGSGAGVQQLTAGTIDFAGSDVPLKPEESAAAQARLGPVLHVPWSAGAVAVMYNLGDVPALQLRPQTLAGIFSGRHTRWDDAAIAADNPGVVLPPIPVQVVHRSDGSGTTAAFTQYLADAAPGVWTAGAGKDISWPTGQGAKGSDGVTRAVKESPGAISYAETSFPKMNKLPVARIGNPAGAFVAPDAPGAVTAALAEAAAPENLQLELDYTPSAAGAYPISTVTYTIVPQRSSKGRLLQSFLRYAVTDGQAAAPGLLYAPLPAELSRRALTAVDRMSTS